MKYFLLLAAFITLPVALMAQEERVDIKGRVYVQSNDLEGIAVYNSSANVGTITDEDGRFEIAVALNDVINFSALQFKDFSIVINQGILDSKRLTTMLVEDVNKLDEVIILPYDLSGSLFVDLNSVRTYNVDMDSIYSGVSDQNKYQLSADFQTGVTNAAVNDQLPYMDNGLNLINLAGLILRPFKKRSIEKQSRFVPKGTLITRYDAEFLETHFKIPRSRSDEFLIFVEENGIQASLWREEKELELLEVLYTQSLVFLNPSTGKN